MVFGPFARAAPLRFPNLKSSLWRIVFSQACLLILWLGLAKPVPKLFLGDSDAPFSASKRLAFWWLFGPFARAVPLRFPILKSSLWSFVFVLSEACLLILWLGLGLAKPVPKLFLRGFRRAVFGP